MHKGENEYLVIILKEFGQQVKCIICTFPEVGIPHKRTPGNTWIIFHDVIIHSWKIESIFIEILPQTVCSQHLGNLDKLIVVVVAFKQRFLSKKLHVRETNMKNEKWKMENEVGKDSNTYHGTKETTRREHVKRVIVVLERNQ